MAGLKKLLVLGMILTFLTGFLSSYAVNSVYIDTEKPFYVGLINDREQPGNWISEDRIEILPDKVINNIENAVLSRYADTGSMLPTLGEDTNGIRIKPEAPEQIKVGDIISYQRDNMLIVHRVIAKGEDERGIYFITKGDNNGDCTMRKIPEKTSLLLGNLENELTLR